MTTPIGHLAADPPGIDRWGESGVAFQLIYLPGGARRDHSVDQQLEGQVATTVVLTNSGRTFALAVIPCRWIPDTKAVEEEFGYRLRVADGGRAEGLRFSTPLIFSAREQGIEVFVDQSLIRLPQVFLETANPHLLIRLDGESFRRSFYGAWCGFISHVPGPIRAPRADKQSRHGSENRSSRLRPAYGSDRGFGAGTPQRRIERAAGSRMPWR